MAHKFDVNNRNKLESEERIRLLAPPKTLKALGYRQGTAAADIGCGIGVFTIPMAEMGGGAKIYAADVSEEMLAEVKRRADEAGLSNILPVKSEEYDFRIGDEAVDFVLVCTVLHEIDDKTRFLKEAARICRKDGKIAIIEFNESYTAYGPPLTHRVTRLQVNEWLRDAGFRHATGTDISEAFYAAVAWKASCS